MNITRRGLIRGSIALTASAFAGFRPSPARAAVGERKFIFFYASGGWDVTSVFDPHFDTDGVDMDDMAEPGQVGNIAYTAGVDRPNVTRFLERWAGRTAFVNGVNAHSVGHESGMQFVMTGTSASSYPDWATVLAGRATGEYPLPNVVFGGPSYPGNMGSAVVRAGGGTLLDLLDASIVGYADEPSPILQTPSDSMVDAFVHDRVAKFAAERGGLGRVRADSLLTNFDRATELEGRRFEAGLTDLGSTMVDQGVKAAEMIRLGLCRCAMIGIDGGYDTHGSPSQAAMFDEFFAALDGIMDHLSSTPGYATPTLADEVVLVALSEFGRTPKYNGGNGRDHWPYGSALVIGSGVRGNRRVGRTDGDLISLPIDFGTGEESATGDIPACENLGAALLQLGGIDPETHLPGVQVLEAILA
jgi:uncharacterized protein (DUF1501 family)